MSKRMTKFLALILTLVMFLSVSTPAFAWGDIGIGNGWGRDIGEDDIRDFEPGEEPEEVEEYDYFSTFDEESGITVTVAAPMGALPLLAEVRVEPVPVDDVRDVVDEVMGYESNVLVAMDISFWLDDIEIEPEEPVRVKIAAPELDGRSDLTVVHIPDEEEPETIELIPSEDLKFELGTNEICFESGDFSVYAVVGGGEVLPEARIQVNFYNPVAENPETPIMTVWVKNSDELLADGQEKQSGHTYINDIVYDPGVGETLPEGMLFRGWSLDVTHVSGIRDNAHYFVGADYDASTDGMTIPEIRQLLSDLKITEGDVLNVYAMVYNVYNVTYQDDKGVVLASDVVLMSVSATVADYTIVHTYEVPDQLHNFEGWHVIEGANNIQTTAAEPYPQGTTMKLTGNVKFSTVVSEGHWLVYEENGYGATYNAPVFIKSGEKAKAPALKMLRPGYTFDGWYTGAPLHEGEDPTGDEYVFDENGEGQELSDRLVLYAKWIVSPTAKYTVIVWKQSVVDDKNAANADKTYDYAFSVEVEDVASNTAVSALDLSEYQGLAGNSNYAVGDNSYNFYGFKYNDTMTAKEGSGNKSIGNGVVANYETVQPNGTTVINLYYDRELVTYDFNIVNGYKTATPDWNSGTTYYYKVNNNYYMVSRSGSNSYYYVPFTGTKNNNTTYYLFFDGQWYAYSRENIGSWYSPYYEWVFEYEGSYYTWNGPIYTRTRITGSQTYYVENWESRDTFTGLYGQKLSKYNYTWPTDYRWINDIGGSTFTSVMDTFDPSVNDNPTDEFHSDFYAESTTYNTNVYHFLQNVDGSYSTAATYTIPTVVGNGMVFRNFQGFTASKFRIKLPDGVYSYTTGTSYNGDNLVNPTSHTTSTGWTDWLPYGTGVEYDGNTRHETDRWIVTEGGIEFRYTRDQFDLTYMVGRFEDRNGAALTPPVTGELNEVKDIPYESNLASYGENGEKWYEPAAQTGYYFVGWFIDETCTTPVDFANITMPMNGLTVYGKWQQTEYRVFLHSNAYTENGDGSYDRDTTLTWGSDAQDMNFRISYNDKVSLPTGQRTGYEFGGWYTDPEFIHPYAADTRLTDSTVPETPEYDKTVDWTDGVNNVEMDKWGLIPDGVQGINKDVDRPWVQRKLVLYARWSKIIVGAEGVGVLYDANGGSNAPSDTLKYKDNIRAVAQAASTAPSDDLVFDYWVLQKWDESQGKFVDIEGSRVYPGDSYTVLVDNAHKVANPDNTPAHPSYTYTIQLRAEYVSKEKPLPTHITWHANNGTGDEIDSETVDINANIQIPLPQSELNREGQSVYYGWDKLVWEDHVFLGWARVEETENMHQDLVLGEEDLFLKYDPATKTFSAVVENGSGGETPEENQYYLVGYFDGADYGGDEYAFHNGKVTATFAQDSYVAVKPAGATDIGAWYFTDDWLGTETKSAVLSNSYAKPDKLFVPGGKPITFTLVENSDGTLTLSYKIGFGTNAVGNPRLESDGETEPTWTKVDYVAADEFSPYHTMYAVWASVFYVYHTGNNTVERVVIDPKATPTVDLASRTTSGFLYGGIYSQYAGVSEGFETNLRKPEFKWSAVETDSMNTLQPQADKNWLFSGEDDASTALAYNGVNVAFDSEKAFTNTQAFGNGLAVKAQAGAVYYIKEVPAASYLQPYFHYTYKKGIEGEPIVTAWLISDIDDQNYTETGFVFVDTNNGKATVCKSLSVTAQTSGNTIKLTPKRVFGVDNSGLLTYRRVMDNYVGLAYNEAGDVFGDNVAVFQYWVTPDGLIVTGTTSRVYTGTAAKANVGCTPTTGSSTIAVFGGNSLAVPAADNQN